MLPNVVVSASAAANSCASVSGFWPILMNRA
jgi:hypothetical protein